MLHYETTSITLWNLVLGLSSLSLSEETPFYQVRWIQEVSIYNLFLHYLLFWERMGKFWVVFTSIFHILFECIYLYSVSGLLNALGFHCLLAFYSPVIRILLKLLDCEIRRLLFLRQTCKTYFAHIICIIRKYVWQLLTACFPNTVRQPI